MVVIRDRSGDQDEPGTRERLVGIALMCAAVVCFACLEASAKWLNQSVHPIMIVWARYFFSLVFIATLVNPIRRPGVMRTSRPWLQIARSVLLLLSTALSFYGLKYLQLTEAVSIQFATPLLVALIAGPILGEWAGPRRMAAIAVGFVGILVIARPGLGGMQPAALFTVASTICYAGYNVMTRILAAHDSSGTTLIYSSLAGLLLITPVLPFVWTTPSSPGTYLLMLATGLFGAIGHGCLIAAHARAPAPILSPFTYSQILWSGILGYVIFGDLPDGWALVGGGIVIASGLYLLSRERVGRSGVSPPP